MKTDSLVVVASVGGLEGSLKEKLLTINNESKKSHL